MRAGHTTTTLSLASASGRSLPTCEAGASLLCATAGPAWDAPTPSLSSPLAPISAHSHHASHQRQQKPWRKHSRTSRQQQHAPTPGEPSREPQHNARWCTVAPWRLMPAALLMPHLVASAQRPASCARACAWPAALCRVPGVCLPSKRKQVHAPAGLCRLPHGLSSACCARAF